MEKTKSITAMRWSIALLLFALIGCGPLLQSVPAATARATPTAVSTKAAAAPRSTPTPGKAADANAIDLGLSGGIVASNNGSALGLRMGGSTLQVQTNASTIVVVPGLKNAQLVDIHVGDRVIANIPGNDPNTPAALLLAIPAGDTANNIVTGVVQASASGVLAVKTDILPRRVTVNAATVVVDMSGDRSVFATLSEVQTNNAVMIVGQPSGDAFTAQVVVIAVKDARNIPGAGK